MRETEEQLISAIEKGYGFQKELIKNPMQHGLWFVSFEVNGIMYCGSIPFAGALPMLKVTGYTTDKYDHDVPVEDEYYNEFIKGKKIYLRHCTDPESGDWENTDKEFSSQDEAKKWIEEQQDPSMWDYSFR